MVLRLVGFAIVMETMEAVAAPQDLLCTMMMTSPLVMPFVWGILFGMRLVNLQETQVVCCQEHPCFEGHTIVGIVLEAIAAMPHLLCAMMMTSPLVMPFIQGILFSMHLVNSQETQVVCHQEHPCFEGHTMVGIVLEAITAMPQDLFFAMMMMTLPLVMPFVQGVLFGMRLVNLQETMSSGTSLLQGSHHGRNRSGGNRGDTTRFVLRNDDDVATGDALRSGHPVWHVPGELAKDSGSMSSGTSLLRGSHCGSNRTGGNGSGGRRFAALGYDDDVTTGDALRLGRPVWHAPGELARDSGSMLSGTSLL
jgi:hypothetical protein